MKIQETILLFCLAALGVILTLDLQKPVLLGFQKDFLASDVYARCVALALSGVSLAALICLLLGRLKAASPAPGWAIVLAKGFLISMLYLIGVMYIGFFVSSFFYLFTLVLLFGGWDLKASGAAAIYALAVTASAKILFSVFKVYLPDALLF